MFTYFKIQITHLPRTDSRNHKDKLRNEQLFYPYVRILIFHSSSAGTQEHLTDLKCTYMNSLMSSFTKELTMVMAALFYIQT